jgi:hypothetical protein
MWRDFTCEHCETGFRRYGRKSQRFCSVRCSHEIKVAGRPTSRRCECCPTVFPIGSRQKNKRFCSMHCLGIWREREKRLNRPPLTPRVRRKPGRIEWSIGGMHRSRGMAPAPRSPWHQLLRRLGYPN